MPPTMGDRMRVDVRPVKKLRESPEAQAVFGPIIEALCSSPADLSRLRVVCDWIQYRNNFRDAAVCRPVLAGRPAQSAGPGQSDEPGQADGRAQSDGPAHFGGPRNADLSAQPGEVAHAAARAALDGTSRPARDAGTGRAASRRGGGQIPRRTAAWRSRSTCAAAGMSTSRCWPSRHLPITWRAVPLGGGRLSPGRQAVTAASGVSTCCTGRPSRSGSRRPAVNTSRPCPAVRAMPATPRRPGN